MKNLHTFIEFVNESYFYDSLDEAVFTPNKGQSAVAYLIGLNDAWIGTRPTLRKSGQVIFDPVDKKYGRGFRNLYYEKAIPREFSNIDANVARDRMAERLGIPKTTFKALIKKMTDKFMSMFKETNKPPVQTPVFYFDEFFNMDPNSLLEYVKKYFENPDSPEYTGKINLEDEILKLPEEFSFLRPHTEGNVLRAKNFSLFDYPNLEDATLRSIKNMDPPYNQEVCSRMIRSGLYSMQLNLTNIDLVLYPKSSSKILKIFAQEIDKFIETQKEKTRSFSTPTTVLGDSFLKLKWKEITPNEAALQTEGDIDNKLKFMYFLEKMQKENPDREFKFSDSDSNMRLNLVQRYLVGRFMKIAEDKLDIIKSAKNILIIDDFITGGSTRKQMESLVKEQNPEAKIINLSIFKIRSS